MKDIINFKSDFPIFTNHPDLVYLDSAATAQKPQAVIDAVTNFYENHNANIHRGIYDLSQDATILFEKTRQKVADFIGATDAAEIIFSGNASEAINLAAYGWARKFLQAGDSIVTTVMEHHSNLVPWLRLREEKGIDVIFLPLSADTFQVHYQELLQTNKDLKKIKLVALTHASNVLGTINPIREIISFLKQNGIAAKILIDGAQSIAHLPINVFALGCDFFAFSSHKMLGPSGVGVLWAKKEVLQTMDPIFVGSHMIKNVSKDGATWADIPDKFEAGTHNLEGVIGLGAAIDFLQKVGSSTLLNHENELTTYMLDMLKNQSGLTLYGPQTFTNRLGVFSFNVSNIHPHDVAEILNRKHIAVRSGHHCAQPLMHILNQSATVRASLYLYTTKEDIDKLAEGIELVQRTLKT